MKEEVMDEEYEDMAWSSLQKTDEDDDSIMVAKKIKQEMDHERSQFSRDSKETEDECTDSSNLVLSRLLPNAAPLVFDHFICMRIGLNSENNVQKLMAVLAAHNFVDLTVIPSPSAPTPMSQPPVVPPTLLDRIFAQSEPSTSLGEPRENRESRNAREIRQLREVIEQKNNRDARQIKEVIDLTLEARRVREMMGQKEAREQREQREQRERREMREQLRKIECRQPKKYTFRKMTGNVGDTTNIGKAMSCRKCGEVVPMGTPSSYLLSHVQKHHLKMAAFQCRICKHYRTTVDRIQSHVTTVHKARSTKFDDSLAGPIAEKDMRLMEAMITKCFTGVKITLEVADRLAVKSYEFSET